MKITEIIDEGSTAWAQGRQSFNFLRDLDAELELVLAPECPHDGVDPRVYRVVGEDTWLGLYHDEHGSLRWAWLDQAAMAAVRADIAALNGPWLIWLVIYDAVRAGTASQFHRQMIQN